MPQISLGQSFVRVSQIQMLIGSFFTFYYHDFVPVEQTSCICPQSIGIPCCWSAQTALLPSNTQLEWILLFFTVVVTSRYSVKMTLCRPDSKYSSKSRMVLHSFICTFDDLSWSRLPTHLRQDLQLVSSVSHVLRPRVLLMLRCKQLLVCFPLASRVYLYKQPKRYELKKRTWTI